MNIFKNASFIDLTQTVSSLSPNWGGQCGFQHKVVTDYKDCSGETKFHTQSIEMFAGIGTHMDAPLHCFPGANDIASIPLQQLIVPCVVIDVSSKADADYIVTSDDIQHFEKHYGKINQNSFIIIRTGWDKFWNNPEQYRNNLIFPTISAQAVELLLERDLVGLGIDTLSPDNEANGFPVHRLVLGAGKYIIENIAHSHQVPPIGAYTLALPMKIQDGTESPTRLIAMTLAE